MSLLENPLAAAEPWGGSDTALEVTTTEPLPPGPRLDLKVKESSKA